MITSNFFYRGVEFKLYTANKSEPLGEICNRCAFGRKENACNATDNQCGWYGYYVCVQNEANLNKFALLKLKDEL